MIKSVTYNQLTGVLEKIQTEAGEWCFTGAGFEVGNWHSFFSHERQTGLRVRDHDSEIVQLDSNGVTLKHFIRMKKLEVEIKAREILVDGILQRRYTLRALEDGVIGDFVVRGAIPENLVYNARVGSHSFPRFVSKAVPNKVNQYPEKFVELQGPEGCLESKMILNGETGRLAPYSYVRYEKPLKNVVFHHRLISFNAFPVHCYRGLITSASWMPDRLLESFLYRRERTGRGIAQVCMVVGISKDEIIRLGADIKCT